MPKKIFIWILLIIFYLIAVTLVFIFVKQKKTTSSPVPLAPINQQIAPTSKETTKQPEHNFGVFISPLSSPSPTMSPSDVDLVNEFNKTINPERWSILFEPVSTAGRVEIINNKLLTQGKKTEKRQDFTFSGVTGKTKFVGDFVMSVTIDSFQTDKIGSGSAEIQFCSQFCRNGIYLYWKKDIGNAQDVFLVGDFPDGTFKEIKLKLGNSINQVTVRLVRSGSTALAYQFEGNKYREIGKLENIYDGPGFLRLGTVIWGSSLPQVQANFSNFSFKGSELK